MESLRHIALSGCILFAMAGMICAFWPENRWKQVINAALLLYIVASVLRMARTAEWQIFAAELRHWSIPAVSAEDYSVYAAELGIDASAQAIATVLRQEGIRVTISVEGDLCHVILFDENQRALAEEVLQEFGGALRYTIEVTGGNP